MLPSHELSRVFPNGDGRLMVETGSGLRGEVVVAGRAGSERETPLVVTLR